MEVALMKKRKKPLEKKSMLRDHRKEYPVKFINYYLQKENSHHFRVTRHLLERLMERSNQFDLHYDENLDNFYFREFKKIEKWLKASSIRYLFNNYFIVEDEFIFTVEIQKKSDKNSKEYISIEFITFLGSTTENPMLYNLDVLYKNKHRYGNLKLEVKDTAMASVV